MNQVTKTFFLLVVAFFSGVFGVNDTLIEVRFSEPVPLSRNKVLSGSYSHEGTQTVSVVILENGIEKKRVETDTVHGLLDSLGVLQKPFYQEESQEKNEDNQIWEKFRKSPEEWLKWAKWEKGMSISGNFSFTHFYPDTISERPWTHKAFNNKVMMSYLTGSRHFVFGGGVIYNNTWGHLADSIIDNRNPSFLLAGWTLTAGIPGITYTLSSNAWVLPDYVWLEKQTPAIAHLKEKDGLLTQYKDENDDISFSTNLAHCFSLKLGVLRYELLLDNDVYVNSVHYLRLQNIPAWHFNWDMGFVFSGGCFSPHIALTFLPVRLPAFSVFKKDVHIKIAPLILGLAYNDNRNFRLLLGWKTHINDFFAFWDGERK
ncbi:MAG: hypothetical protein HQK83_12015 [Fibrobacteria bacterium]|nr:hypothetical protein [Fibrobacteria bacterium]